MEEKVSKEVQLKVVPFNNYDADLLIDCAIHYSFHVKKFLNCCPDFMKKYYQDRLDHIYELVDKLSNNL